MPNLTVSSDVDSLMQSAAYLEFARKLRCPKVLFSFSQPVGNVGTGETVLYSGSLPANLYAANGDSVEFLFCLGISFDGIDARYRFRIAGNNFIVTGLLQFAGILILRLTVTRFAADSLKIASSLIGFTQDPQVVLTTDDATGEFDFSSALTFELTGQCNDDSDEVSASSGKVIFQPA